jgi:outer membrane PBP1 activator LpoA protein
MFNKGIDLLEGPLVKQHIESLSSSHFTAIVLRINSCLTSASLASSLPSAQVIETLFC